MSRILAYCLILLNIVADGTPITPLSLKIDLPTTYYYAPPGYGVNPTFILNIAGLQLFGSSCPSTGCIGQGGLFSYNSTVAMVLYAGGAGHVTTTMSSVMTRAHDVLDVTASPNKARNASYCLDGLMTTYCSTDYSGNCMSTRLFLMSALSFTAIIK